MKLSFKEAAVVVWLPEGEQPTDDHFRAAADHRPPNPNPEAWWELGDALLRCRTGDDTPFGKEPWIKVGDALLSPRQVIQAYEAFKIGKDFDA
jgi:hypothetical protein